MLAWIQANMLSAICVGAILLIVIIFGIYWLVNRNKKKKKR